MTWQHDAACKGQPVDIFYPTHGDHYTIAQQTCAGCPVTTECLQDAIATQDHHGYRAGHTPDQLAVIIHGTTDLTRRRRCDWCGASFTLGKFQNRLTRFCSPVCGKAADRQRWKEKRREMGGRAGAA